MLALIEEWILCDKIRLVDIHQKIRITYHSVYIVSFRIDQDIGIVERYVADLRILLEDLSSSHTEDLDKGYLLEKILWDGMYFGEGYFKGEKLFDAFVYEQKEKGSSLFKHAELPFPNRYAL